MTLKVQIRNELGEVIYERPVKDWDDIEMTEYSGNEDSCWRCGAVRFIHIKHESKEICRQCGASNDY